MCIDSYSLSSVYLKLFQDICLCSRWFRCVYDVVGSQSVWHDGEEENHFCWSWQSRVSHFADAHIFITSPCVVNVQNWPCRNCMIEHWCSCHFASWTYSWVAIGIRCVCQICALMDAVNISAGFLLFDWAFIHWSLEQRKCRDCIDLCIVAVDQTLYFVLDVFHRCLTCLWAPAMTVN